ncbi:MAG: metal-dependent hydrolase [Segniliparus sp.]|uniref:metal-dependent hydrolase n=1 Tax=Segniliparus sp. TaxID=2804064 RepID=UPI003F2C9CE4
MPASFSTASSMGPGFDDFATGEIALRPRDVRFDLSRSPLHWIPGEPYASHSYSSLHLILPAGERWFCKVLAESLEYVKDQELIEQVRGFMGQEAIHARCHDDAMTEYLQSHGVDPAPFVRQMEWLFGRLGRLIDEAEPDMRKRAVVTSLFLVAAVEHFTAVLGNWVLNSRWEEFGADPALSDLFRWHGAEEIEHRHVAYNVAQYFGAPYPMRLLLGLCASAGLIALVFRGMKYLVRHDPSMPDAGYARVFWESHKAGKKGATPRLRSVLAAVGRLFNPRYSPEREGNTAQAVAYLATSPAARAVRV